MHLISANSKFDKDKVWVHETFGLSLNVMVIPGPCMTCGPIPHRALNAKPSTPKTA